MWKTGTRVTTSTWPGSSLTRTRRHRPPTSLASVRTERMMRDASPLSSTPLDASASSQGKSRFFTAHHAFGLWCCSVDCSNVHPRTVLWCRTFVRINLYSNPLLTFLIPSRYLHCYLLGITLHEVTTGLEPPLDGIAWHQMRDGRVPPPPPELKRSDDLWTLIVEMMSGEPEARQSASQILRHPRVEEATIGAC